VVRDHEALKGLLKLVFHCANLDVEEIKMVKASNEHGIWIEYSFKSRCWDFTA